MTQPQPERHLGTKCGQMLDAGLMSYQCSLPLGHDKAPESDPEPHYAVESARSVRQWQAWKKRQDEALDVAQNPPTMPCPVCHTGTMTVNVAAGTGNCSACGAEVPISPDPDVAPAATAHMPEEQTTPDWDLDPTSPADPLGPPYATAWIHGEHEPDEEHQQQVDAGLDFRTYPEWMQALHPDMRLVDSGFEDLMPQQRISRSNFEARYATSVAEAPVQMFDETAPRPKSVEEADRQIERDRQALRPGDQRLPDGATEDVDDAQALVIADLVSRRALGIQRYGQALMPFNGRDTHRDEYEELLDLLVYRRSIMQMAEADRETLVEVVRKALADQGEADTADWARAKPEYDDKRRSEFLAEVAVDRVMDWVSAQREEMMTSVRIVADFVDDTADLNALGWLAERYLEEVAGHLDDDTFFDKPIEEWKAIAARAVARGQEQQGGYLLRSDLGEAAVEFVGPVEPPETASGDMWRDPDGVMHMMTDSGWDPPLEEQ